MRRTLVIVVFFCIFLSQPLSYSADNIPLHPCDFYGSEESPGTLIAGLSVTAVDPDGIVIGSILITTNGQYGFLSCSADDPTTPEDEGAADGDIITFYTGGIKQQKQAVFESGDAVNVDLGIAAGLGAFNLHLTSMPSYLSYNDIRYSGVAVADMILDFLDPSNTDDQPALMSYADLNADNITTGSELARLLNNKEPGAYHFGSTSDIERYSDWGIIDTFDATNQEDVIKQLCHWMTYKVPNTEAGKEYVPSAICTSSFDSALDFNSDYKHWMSVVGVKTNQDPHPSLSDDASFREVYRAPDTLELFGVYLNDPNQSGLGFHMYVAANDFCGTYFKPIASELEEAGKYVAVMEPPSADAKPTKLISPLRNPNLQFTLTTPGKEISIYIPRWINPRTKHYLLKILEDLKTSEDFITLLDDSYFGAALEDTKVRRCYKVVSKTNDNYTIIPFEKDVNEKMVTTAAVIMNNETGQFQIAFADPEAESTYAPFAYWKAYSALRKHIGRKVREYPINRYLINAEGSPLYPGWTIVILKQYQKNNILTLLSKEYIISHELKILEEKSSPEPKILYNCSYKLRQNSLKMVMFEVKNATVAIDWKSPTTRAYVYNYNNRYLVIVQGKNPYCRVKIEAEGSTGNIREGKVTYLYIR